MSKSPKGAVQIALIAALVLPIVLYTIKIVGRRGDEVRRYHQEMVALEKELRHSLEALGEIVISASRLDKENKIPGFTQQAGELLSQDRVKIKRKVALVDSSQQASISSCLINWDIGTEKMSLAFKVDWPIGVQGAKDDVRLRYTGNIDVGKVLDESRKVTNFDALLIADDRGDLIQKFGADADRFSALPGFTDAEWRKSFETTRNPGDAASLFLPVTSTITREIAGRTYTIFPREIVLRSNALEGEPLYCRTKPDQGKEFLRLRIVGLISAERLAILAVRPSETLYWCVVFYYVLVTCIFIEIRRPRGFVVKPREEAEIHWRSWKLIEWISVIGFGLALGTFVISSYKIYSYQKLVDRDLGSVLFESVRKADERMKSIEGALQDTRPSWCFGLARCAEIGENGWMSRYTFGSLDLQDRNVADRAYFREALKAENFNKFIVEPIISRASGLREIVVARQIPQIGKIDRVQNPLVRSITTSLITLREQPSPANLGIAIVDAHEGRWRVRLTSEPYRQADQDLLQQFSDPDCLEVKLRSPNGGFCSGLLYGRPARALVIDGRKLDHPPGSSQCYALGCIEPEGKIGLIAYSFQDSFNARLAATLQVTIILLCVVFVLVVGVLFAAAKPAPRLRRWRNSAAGNIRTPRSKRFIILDWSSNFLMRAAHLALPFALGSLILLGCWSIEDDWQHRIFTNSVSTTTRSIAEKCRSAYPCGAAGIASTPNIVSPVIPCCGLVKRCIDLETSHLIALADSAAPSKSEPGRLSQLASHLYLKMRPVSGRYTGIIPALDGPRSAAPETQSCPEVLPAISPTVPLKKQDERQPFAEDVFLFLVLRLTMAALILYFFIGKPSWLKSSLGSAALSAGASLSLFVIALTLLFFRQELLAALTAFLGTLDKLQGTVGNLLSRFSGNSSKK